MTTLENLVVAVHHMSGPKAYPEAPPFHPPVAFPEYPFNTGLDRDNLVYAAVRETLQSLGLDQAHMHDQNWNPLGEIIRPGNQVLIKPNLVKHYHNQGHDTNSIVTHGSVVRAILDYVYIALRGEGKIIVGDAPLQKANMDQVLRVTGLDGVLRFYATQAGIEVEFADFRLEQADTKGTMVVRRRSLPGARDGYLRVDLGKNSYLDEISASYLDYRVTDFDRREMQSHHNENVNEYLIPRSVLESQVILNLPKLKTHRKAGVTISLKNLVGINGCKDWLPHHRNGSVEEGGDEYLHPSWRKRADTLLDEQVDISPRRWQKYALRFGRLLLRISDVLVSYPDPYKEGSWWGNDTLWRTVLDLNRILFYADKRGVMTDHVQRRYLSLVDGIIAGEAEGPLEPTPRPCGLIIAGFNPVLVDTVCAKIMGFDPAKIPLIRHAGRNIRLIPRGHATGIRVVSNELHWVSAVNWHRENSLAFCPSRDWAGYIEAD